MSHLKHPIKVGSRLSKRGSVFSYAKIKSEANGWVDAEKYLPADLDLVFLKLEDGKVISGWIFGKIWDGYRLMPNHKVTHWRVNLSLKYMGNRSD